MTYSTMVFFSRRALQLTALFVATAPASFGGEPVLSNGEGQLIGHVVVTAPRERELMGHIVVTADRLAPEYVAIADLGAMTVTARRETPLASNEASHSGLASL